MSDAVTKDTMLRAELQAVLNKYCMENGSNTPDFILTNYLLGCLEIYDKTVNDREKWHGRSISWYAISPSNEDLQTALDAKEDLIGHPKGSLLWAKDKLIAGYRICNSGWNYQNAVVYICRNGNAITAHYTSSEPYTNGNVFNFDRDYYMYPFGWKVYEVTDYGSIDWARTQLEAGNKIRLSRWKPGQYIYKINDIIYCDSGKPYCHGTITLNNFTKTNVPGFQNGWEIYGTEKVAIGSIDWAIEQLKNNKLVTRRSLNIKWPSNHTSIIYFKLMESLNFQPSYIQIRHAVVTNNNVKSDGEFGRFSLSEIDPKLRAATDWVIIDLIDYFC